MLLPNSGNQDMLQCLYSHGRVTHIDTVTRRKKLPPITEATEEENQMEEGKDTLVVDGATEEQAEKKKEYLKVTVQMAMHDFEAFLRQHGDAVRPITRLVAKELRNCSI